MRLLFGIFDDSSRKKLVPLVFKNFAIEPSDYFE